MAKINLEQQAIPASPSVGSTSLFVDEADGVTKQINSDGQVTAFGGSQPLQVLGPFTVNYNDANFVNPNDNGIATIAIPAGTLVLDVIPIQTVGWRATGNLTLDETDQLYVGVLASPSGSGPMFATFILGSGADGSPNVALGAQVIQTAALQGGSPEAVNWGSQKRSVLAVGDCYLVVAAFINEDALVAGSLDLYALVATPS